ncbi:MAG: DUF6434 domain-containing protein [Verrucomicrobiota bacterium]
MPRPSPAAHLSEAEFLRWYWLRSELSSLCRLLGIPASGNKEEVTARIAAHLGNRPPPPRTSTARTAPPATLTPETPVTPGWTLSAQLRQFFVHHCGKSFRFNQSLRDFFRSGSGTLADALATYRASLANPARDIPKVFEFNRFARAFRQSHPHASHEDMTRAWHHARSQPR